MQQTIKDMFGVSSTVIYPPVSVPEHTPKKQRGEYFLSVGRIDCNKHLELSILACNKLRLAFKIIGETNNPSYESYLHRISGSTIQFLGQKTDSEITKFYTKAKAFLFTAKNEDFGIAPLEAISFGVPVIAYYGGGVKETVIQGKTGLFFYDHSAEALAHTLATFEVSKFNPNALHTYAQKFNKKKFKTKIQRYIQTNIGINISL